MFHLLCGIPGSGKSTIAKDLNGYVVSTDSIRKFCGTTNLLSNMIN